MSSFSRGDGCAVMGSNPAENARYFRNALVRANYTNLPRGVHPTPIFLERFFANLLLGEKNALKSRYLHVSLSATTESPASEKREQVGEQVKTDAVKEIQARPSKQVLRLLSKMKGEMTVLEMIAALKLGGRRNFLERYLTPALNAGLIERTEPDSAHSPTQRYRLTWSGKASLTKFDLRKGQL